MSVTGGLAGEVRAKATPPSAGVPEVADGGGRDGRGAAAPDDGSPVVSGVMVWLLYLTALIRPALTLAFLLFSARLPHGAAASLLWLGTIGFSVALDALSGRERAVPTDRGGAWFDLHLYIVFAVQALVFVAFVHTLGRPDLTLVDGVVATILVGTNSGYASLILAHELIHRGRSTFRLMGRALLTSCLYEHWFTEHLRAHHANFGMNSDAGSARAGESYWRFCWRSVPGQLVSAWRLEATRLGNPGWLEPRWLRSRVVQGLLVQAALLGVVTFVGGPGGLIAMVAQAAIAVSLLEAVDYFTHWGLTRDDGEVSTAWSWDSESRLTLYSMLGLARHADHHLHPGRPFHQLRTHEGSLKLPHGYPVMVLLAMFANGRFQRTLLAIIRTQRAGQPAVARSARLVASETVAGARAWGAVR